MYIANAVLKSGYSPEEAVDILWLEVFPALCDNLRVVAGEWAGFEQSWLEERVVAVISGGVSYNDGGLLSIPMVASIIESEWGKCLKHLPACYHSTTRTLSRERDPCTQSGGRI